MFRLAIAGNRCSPPVLTAPDQPLGASPRKSSALRIVTATGEVLECSAAADPEVFRAAQVSLGSLGVITAVQLQLLLPSVPIARAGARASRSRVVLE